MHDVLSIVNGFYYAFAAQFLITCVKEIKERKCDQTVNFFMIFSILNLIKRALESSIN